MPSPETLLGLGHVRLVPTLTRNTYKHITPIIQSGDGLYQSRVLTMTENQIYRALGFNEEETKFIEESKGFKMSDFYTVFKLKKKSGGLRTISAPVPILKQIQKKISYLVSSTFTPDPAATGFIRGKSVREGAERHVGACQLYCTDIRNFFPSIGYREVIRTMTRMIYRRLKLDRDSEDTIKAIKRLASMCLLSGGLAQGSPCSPAISNVVMAKVDAVLRKGYIHLKVPKEDYVYTRYVDDISISTKGPTKTSIDFLEACNAMVDGALSSQNHVRHPKKTRVKRQNRRMVVTGVVVNEKTNIRRKTKNNLRRYLNYLIKSGKVLSSKEYAALAGKVNWIQQLNPQAAKSLIKQLKEVKYGVS